jgi:phosphoserine aminotransferase
MARVINFNPGPSTLPRTALDRARDELIEYGDSGMSVLEMSHRSPEFLEIHEGATCLVRRLLDLPEVYRVLFLQGGASLQFAMLPMNLLHASPSAGYVITGAWARKAWQEARTVAGDAARAAASTEDRGFDRLPSAGEIDVRDGDAYLHVTSNNTIHGTQWQTFPDTGDVPLVGDMSSDLMSRPVEVRPFGLIYAGAQKNLGPAGVTVVILRDDVLAECREDLPSYLSYRVHVAKGSLFNTPPCFAIYMLRNVLARLEEEGGLEAAARRNREKADLVYGCIDRHGGFYRGTVYDPRHRSWMNATFRLPDEDLEQRFVEAARREGMVGLQGHRSVGGIRASLYNAVSLDDTRSLVSFMEAFARRNG